MSRKKLSKSEAKSKQPKKQRVSAFPASTFEDALTIAQAIQNYNAGKPMRRITIFDQLGKSPDSGRSRQLVTNSSKYGLTKGSYQAEIIELTEDGRLATSDDVSKREQTRARFQLAIEGIPIFAKIFDQYKNNRLPVASALKDLVITEGISESDAAKCIETFIVNAKYVGILRTVAGAERILTLDHILEELPSATMPNRVVQSGSAVVGLDDPLAEDDGSNVCFYVAPIGSEESEERKHSDLFMGALVEPALQEFGMKLIRADSIGEPGMITAQILEHVTQSRLVIADLSFHNPNVFYELALRHATKRPVVQILRAMDKIPFDINQFRTIVIDNTDIYSLVPQLESYKAEIATQIRSALEGNQASNPLTIYYPSFWEAIQKQND